MFDSVSKSLPSFRRTFHISSSAEILLTAFSSKLELEGLTQQMPDQTLFEESWGQSLNQLTIHLHSEVISPNF